MPWVIGLQRLSLGVSQLNAWMSQQDLEPAFDRYCTKGSENVLNNNLDQVLVHLKESLDIQPRLTHAHLWLARIYCLSEEWDLAIENYLAYIDRRPDNPLAYMELATAYEASEMSSYDLSKSIDRIAIPEPNPKSVVAWQGSGLAASQMVAAGDEQLRAGKDEAALRWYIRAIWLQPNSAEAWFGIGKLLEQSGDLEVANEAYKMAWSFDPARFSSQYAESLDTLGDTEALESLLLQALKQFPESKYRFQWWRLILRTYRNQGKWDQVIQSGLSALEEYPHMVDLIVELGWAYYHRGDGPEKAKQVFQQGIAQDEQRPEGYFAMGQLFNKEKQYSEADEWFLKAIQQDNFWNVFKLKGGSDV